MQNNPSISIFLWSSGLTNEDTLTGLFLLCSNKVLPSAWISDKCPSNVIFNGGWPFAYIFIFTFTVSLVFLAIYFINSSLFESSLYDSIGW